MTHSTLALNVHDSNARALVDEAIDAAMAVDENAPRVAITLEGEQLPATTVSAMISGLRRIREHGGAIRVDAASPALRDALALTGLDRVFAYPLEPGDVPAVRRSRSSRPPIARVAVAAFALLWSALAFAPTVAQSDAEPDPAAMLARVAARNPALSSYQGRLHVDVRLISFPFLRQHLDGTTYYKRPANYEVVFDRVPGFAKGFEKLYTDLGDPSSWEKRFSITYVGEKAYEGHIDRVLRMVQRVRGMIDHETVLLDPANDTIEQIRYDYYNGGQITMTQRFHDFGGSMLLTNQDAEIAIPHIRAVANGTFTDYKTNVAIDDAVFVKAPNQ